MVKYLFFNHKVILIGSNYDLINIYIYKIMNFIRLLKFLYIKKEIELYKYINFLISNTSFINLS